MQPSKGPDFSGKSTLVRAIKPLLADADPPTHFTREPGGTPVAERIRSLVLDPEVEMDACKRADERTRTADLLQLRVCCPGLDTDVKIYDSAVA